MIKPVTYQGVFNFKANLYALEIKSRFIDQNNADGFYKGYGEELAANTLESGIEIGTGAFLVQGRMNEITEAEMLSVPVNEASCGYVVARIETFHPSDEENCILKVYTAQSFDEIVLRKDDVYSSAADETNKVYELPLYSFVVSGGEITELKKLISPIEDYSKVKTLADEALTAAVSAVSSSESAVSTANIAAEKAHTAYTSAVSASKNSVSAVTIAQKAEATVKREHTAMSAEIEELAAAIANGQGTLIRDNGEFLAIYDRENIIENNDTVVIDGGGV